MEVITDLNLFSKPKIAIVTQGTFDGVHAGHQQILSNIVRMAKTQQGKSILLTFDPHPRQFLNGRDNTIKLLTNLDEKIELFENIGLDYLIILPFNQMMAKMSANNFVRDILVEKIGVTTMVVGHDHRFGKNREGSFFDLLELSELYGFKVAEIAAIDVNDATVSSTKIRDSIKEGNMITANQFLNRSYSLTGKVVEGKKLGATLGYPTANIEILDNDKLIPCNGIYAVLVKYKNSLYKAMMSIGNNPTIQNAKWSIEVHLFNFNKNIYNEMLTVFFVKKTRDEIKFNSLADLTEELMRDEKQCLEILSDYETY